MGHVYIHIRVDIFEIRQISCDSQNAWTTASRWLIVILWKPRVPTTRTSYPGTITPRAIWYMDHISIHTRVKILANRQSSCE